MSILITGAAGFIGSHLAEHLIENNELIVGLDNFDDYYDPSVKRANTKNIIKQIPFYEQDLRDSAKLHEIIKKEKVHKVCHLAARPGVRPSLVNPCLYNEINTKGTLTLLEEAKEQSVEQFIFSSTSSIYGANDKVPFSEIDNVEKQISPYAISKRAAELYCYNFANLYRIPTTILRLFTVYGPRQRPEMAIHKFTRKITSGKPLTMFGDGTTARDYTYIDDIIDGFVSALEKPFDFEIINLGNSNPTKLKDLIKLIERTAGKEAVTEQLPEQPGDMKITFADISKAKELLIYQPKIPIEQGIKLFVEWYQTQESGVSKQ